MDNQEEELHEQGQRQHQQQHQHRNQHQLQYQQHDVIQYEVALHELEDEDEDDPEEIDINDEQIPMEVVNAADSEESSDNEYDDDDDDRVDENDDEDEDEDENEDEDEDNAVDPVDIIGWMNDENDDEYTMSTLRRFHRYFVQNRTERLYKFKPLHLFKCNYRLSHSPGEYPTPRSGHRVIASDSHLYSLGGYNPNRVPSILRQEYCMLFQELWAYNFATERWTLLLNAENAEMPKEMASNAVVLYNNVLISHGGTDYPFGETCSNDCHVYILGQTPRVIQLDASGDFPTAQYGPAIVVHNGYLYTIGGTTGFDYTCDVYRLNLKQKTWEKVYICRPEIRDDPEGRYRHEVVYDGNYVYVLGGGTSSTVYDLQRVPAFNLDVNKWEYFNTIGDPTADTVYPKPRKCLSCVQVKTPNGDIEAFITGGLQGDFVTYFDDIWKLNLRTKQWTKIHTASLPHPLYFHSAAHANNGCMYIFGGIEYNKRDMRRRNDLYKMWMVIPKLSEMCWDAMTYYNNNLNKYSRDTLLSIGIPKNFVDRLPLKRDKDNLPTTSGSAMRAIE